MTTFAVHCLGRMSFGHKITNDSSEIADFEALGSNDDARLDAYLNQQLNWQNIDDSEFEDMIAVADYQTLDKPLTQMWLDHHVNRYADGFQRDRPRFEMEQMALARAVYSKRQLLEVLADFWHNHFNVFSGDYYTMSTLVSWDRDVIRPPVAGHPRPVDNPNGHLLGNFRQMLELSSKHTSMLRYLDNYINREGSPNENYAREIIELHTLGAENYVSLGDPASIPRTELSFPWGTAMISDKYVDDDIYAAMRMLTGWKLKDNTPLVSANNEDTGEFFFYEPWHDPFEKTILGHQWDNFTSAPDDILKFFDVLAYHPGTAQHIAGKLCRRFISDNPPQTIINKVADTFYDNRYEANQLELVYKSLFQSAAFRSSNNYKKKLKRPFELCASAMRACGSDFLPKPYNSTANSIMHYFLQRAGQRPFRKPTPDGYPDIQEYWISGMVLMYSMRMVDYLLDRDEDGNKITPVVDITVDASSTDLPSHTPNNITTFWMKRILGYEPSGGWGGSSLHTDLRNFMRQHPSDPSQWPGNVPFSDITTNAGPYYLNERLRGLVKLIISSPEFMYR